MPYKSKAQHRFFRAAESRGELPKGTASNWAHHTKSLKKLPEHVSKKGNLSCAPNAVAPPLAPVGAKAPAAMTPPAVASQQPQALSPRAKMAYTLFHLGYKHRQPLLQKAAALVARGHSLTDSLCQVFPEKTAEQLFDVATRLARFTFGKRAQATPSTVLPAPGKSQLMMMPKQMAKPPVASVTRPIPAV